MSVVHARRSTEHTAEHACHRKGFQMLKIIAYCTKISKKEAMSCAINNTLIIYFQYNKLECFENTVEPFLEKQNSSSTQNSRGIPTRDGPTWTRIRTWVCIRSELGHACPFIFGADYHESNPHYRVVVLGSLNVLFPLMIPTMYNVYVSEGVTWT